MIEETFVLKHFSDTNVEPTSLFVQKAGHFSSSITVKCDNRAVNAKSLMGMMMLGLCEGTTISVSADGPDEQDALTTIKKEFA